jgi:hypothetical protein
MSTALAKQDWGDLGPAMQALTEMQRDAWHLLTGKPGHGALTSAARAAGYKESKPGALAKHAHDLSRNPKIIAGINEEAKKVVRGVGHAEAVTAIMAMIRDPSHRDHARAVDMILSRADAVVTKQSIDVVHRTVDTDQEALEELRALRKLGVSAEKLREVFGGNYLRRLERLEAADIERRSEKATAKLSRPSSERRHQPRSAEAQQDCPADAFIIRAAAQVSANRFYGCLVLVSDTAQVFCRRQQRRSSAAHLLWKSGREDPGGRSGSVVARHWSLSGLVGR